MAMKPLSEQCREILALPIQHEPLSRDEQCLGVGRAQERARTAALDSIVPDLISFIEQLAPRVYGATEVDLHMLLDRIRKALSEGT